MEGVAKLRDNRQEAIWPLLTTILTTLSVAVLGPVNRAGPLTEAQAL